MKLFNLEKAIAGEPVVTRDGRKAKFGCYNPEAKECEKLIFYINYSAFSFFDDGKFEDVDECESDLFMDEQPKAKKGGWVNVHYNDWGYPFLSSIYKTKEDAETNKDISVIDTIKIEWEE